MLLYYIVAWNAVGRDPRRGTIIPLFEAPLGLDAAGVRYVSGMGYDERCFTAALVSLGVKGWLRIDEKDGEFTLTRGNGKQTPLSVAGAIAPALAARQQPTASRWSRRTMARSGPRSTRSATA